MRAAALRHIASRDNPDYRLWLRLAQGRPPRGDRRVLLEGEHLCRAWFAREDQAVVAFMDERAAGTAAGQWLAGRMAKR